MTSLAALYLSLNRYVTTIDRTSIIHVSTAITVTDAVSISALLWTATPISYLISSDGRVASKAEAAKYVTRSSS